MSSAPRPVTAPSTARHTASRSIWVGLALLMAGGLLGCGPTEPPAPLRFAVVERLQEFELLDEASQTERFSRSFQPGADESWSFQNHELQSSDGEILSARNLGQLTLSGPRDGKVNASLQHFLQVRLRAEGAGSLHLWWRKQSEAWDSARSSAPIPFDFDGTWQTVRFGLASMRGRNDSDVSEGVSQFRIRFTPSKPGAEISVEIDEIALLSDFDLQRDALQLLKHQGTNVQGRVIPSDTELSTWIEPSAHERLRFALAAGGAPVTVQLSDDAGRLPALSIALNPNDDWREFKVDLSPLAGRRSKLTWKVSTDTKRSALALLGATLRLAPEEKPAPNLVLYLEDTLRADHLGSYGYAFETDPALAAIAQQGVLMQRTFAASSWTRPSVSTLLSSLNPTRHGNRTHLNRLPESAQTLAETLGAAGWVTRSFVTNYHGGQWAGLDQGFDLAGDALAHGASHLANTLTSELVAGPLEEFLREHADERVFVYVHTLDPHSPYEAPAKLRSGFQRSRRQRKAFTGPSAEQHMTDSVNYDAEILYNDKRLERLDKLLSELGQHDNTLFVFLSDHGEAWQEHDQFEHRKTLHQEEVHVPWILRWPNGLPSGVTLNAPVGLIDVSPTLVGLLGATAPSTWQGRDLSTWMQGKRNTPPRADDPLLLDLVFEHRIEDKIGELAVVKGAFKLILDQFADHSLSPTALYNLELDPGELHNLLDEPQQARAVEALSAWARSTLSVDRASSQDASSAPMSEAQRRNLIELGYIHDEEQN